MEGNSNNDSEQSSKTEHEKRTTGLGRLVELSTFFRNADERKLLPRPQFTFYRQMCPQNLDDHDHDLKPGCYYPRILPSLPTTARRSRTTVPLYYTGKALCSVALCHDRRTL